MVDKWFGWFEGGGRIGSNPVRLVTALLLFTSLLHSVSDSYNSSVYKFWGRFTRPKLSLTCFFKYCSVQFTWSYYLFSLYFFLFYLFWGNMDLVTPNFCLAKSVLQTLSESQLETYICHHGPHRYDRQELQDTVAANMQPDIYPERKDVYIALAI